MTDDASFAAALKQAAPGDTLKLADGNYSKLLISRVPGVIVEGGRAAKVAGLLVRWSSDVTLRGFTIAPPGDDKVQLQVVGSSRVTAEDLLVDGSDQLAGSNIFLDDDVAGFTLRDSELTNCGRNDRCVLAQPGTKNTVISGNDFHDCFDCDFIQGNSEMTITGNTFDRAVNGSCEGGPSVCNHNDHIQIVGGGPWTIVGNRFGDRNQGAASIFIDPGRENTSNPIHDVYIASNIFTPVEGRFGIAVGDFKLDQGLIRDITIVNNTVFSGALSSIAIYPDWRKLPADEQPLVANNIMGALSRNWLCPSAQLVDNVSERGRRCPGVRIARTRLSANGAPTDESQSIIDQADPAYAPRNDFFGNRWRQVPDIGAIEFRGRKPSSGG